MKLAKNASEKIESVMRFMEYEFPGRGFTKVTDQFMLGSDILVAPVMEKGLTKRTVRLLNGKWKDSNGKEYHGGQAVEIL